jgi:hypothetical protein
LGKTLVENDLQSYRKTLGIIKRYYSEGQPLAKEREVFDTVVESRGMTETAARHVLDEVKSYVKSLDAASIEAKKSCLIREIHHAFGKDFFDVHRVPEYRLFASVHMLVEQFKNKKNEISEGVKRVQLEEALVKFMMTPVNESIERNAGEKVDGLVAQIAMKKFEDKYSGALNESQKKTLRCFMNFSMTGNKEQFTREMREEKTHLLESLRSSEGLACFKDDKIMAGKFKEALRTLEGISDVTAERSVKDVLLFQKLAEEIKSDE